MYCPGVAVGLEWVAGKTLNCKCLPDLSAAHGLTMPSHNGCFGMGGIPAFDNLPTNIPCPPRADGKKPGTENVIALGEGQGISDCIGKSITIATPSDQKPGSGTGGVANGSSR